MICFHVRCLAKSVFVPFLSKVLDSLCRRVRFLIKVLGVAPITSYILLVLLGLVISWVISLLNMVFVFKIVSVLVFGNTLSVLRVFAV